MATGVRLKIDKNTLFCIVSFSIKTDFKVLQLHMVSADYLENY
jgi:hypothetical protein